MTAPPALGWEDKLAVMELIWRYNHAIDDGDADGVADCFVPDGMFEGRSGEFVGRAQLRKLGMTWKETLYPRHIVSNILVTAHPTEAGVAEARSHLFFYEVMASGFHFKTSGLYTDVVVKTGGAWKFRSRLMTLDQPKVE